MQNNTTQISNEEFNDFKEVDLEGLDALNDLVDQAIGSTDTSPMPRVQRSSLGSMTMYSPERKSKPLNY
jgi:hypothetical protein